MENASKALIMAGSVLISLIIISLLVVFFQNLRSLQQTKDDLNQADQAAEFNKQYDVYYRDVYGSELFSIANKVADYNNQHSNAEEYEPIELEVQMVSGIDGNYFKAGNKFVVSKNTGNQLQNELKRIEDDKDKLGTITIAKLTIAEMAAMRTKEIENYGINLNMQLSSIKLSTDKNGQNMTVQQAINKYNSLKSIITQAKSKKFKLVGFDLEPNTGRVIKMKYKLQ